MTIDHISNMLTHIRNAVKVNHTFTVIPFNKVCLAILDVLKKEGYISQYDFLVKKNQKFIKIFFKYNGWWIQRPIFSMLKRISKPGQRILVGYRKLNKRIATLKYKQGIAIISTPLGVMSHTKAINLKQGGEILCYIE